MQGTGQTVSRLSATRAFLAGAAILVSATLRPVYADGALGRGEAPEETAMAVPRVKPPAGGNGVGLPQPLAPSEAALVRRIFALQRQGALSAALGETARLTDQTLLGHLLADRFLSRPGRAAAPALADWLGRYADLPDASAIYALLLHKLPASAPRPLAPTQASLGKAEPVTPADCLSAGATPASAAARAAFLRGSDAQAKRLGRQAWVASGGRDPQSAYVAGLAAWRRREFAAATPMFEAASLAPSSTSGLRAAASYWAARAHLRQGEAAAWRPWMERAAAEPEALHGMLARRVLGLAEPLPPETQILGQADADAVAATPQGNRAFALLQVGATARAEAELRGLWPMAQSRLPLGHAVFRVAQAAGLSGLSDDFSAVLHLRDSGPKIPVLRPRGGFRLNPALVYAVARVESNFDAAAVSLAGAHGLMQLMPDAEGPPGTARGLRALRDPAMNLKMGQDYLAHLSRPGIAGDDLLLVLASYNSGPGAVQRWQRPTDDDPMLFLEAIPVDQTRQYLVRTLTYMGRYAARFGVPAPALDALAAGRRPLFSAEWANGAPPPHLH